MPWRRRGAARAARGWAEAPARSAPGVGFRRVLPLLEAGLAVVLLVAIVLFDGLAGGTRELGLRQWMAGVGALLMAADAALRSADAERRGLLSGLAERGLRGTAAFLVLAGALVAIQLFAFRDYFVDDAFITFRYAQHLVLHGQVTWNLGDAPVEGYSNFLWMLLAAGALSVSADPLLVSRLVSLLALALAVRIVLRLAHRIGADAQAARLSALTLLAIPGFVFWAMSGLETASVVVLGLALLDTTAHDAEQDRLPWRSVVVALLLLLSRPEAPLFVGLALLPLLVGGDAAARRCAFRIAAITALAIAPYFAWKLAHFDAWVANSAVAKAGVMRGLPIVTQAYLFAFPFVLLAISRAARGMTRVEQQIWCLNAGFAVAGLHVATQVAHQFRFFLPVIAGLCVIVGPALLDLATRGVPAPRRRATVAVAAAALMLYALAPVIEAQGYAGRESQGLERAHVRVGHALASTYRGQGLLAASDCGLIPYLSRMRTIDLWGLNDARIARDGLDPAAVMARAPDVVILHSLSASEFRAREAYDLAMHPAVLRERGLILRDRVEFAGYWLWVWSRRPLGPSDPTAQFSSVEPSGVRAARGSASRPLARAALAYAV